MRPEPLLTDRLILRRPVASDAHAVFDGYASVLLGDGTVSILPMEKKESGQKKGGFRCAACGAEFQTQQQLDNHDKQSHQKKP